MSALYSTFLNFDKIYKIIYKILRNLIAENSLGGGCIECGRMIEAGNFQGVRAKYYDEFIQAS